MSFQRPEQGVFCQEMGIRDRSFLSSLPQFGGIGIGRRDGHRWRNDCTLARYQCDLRANSARQSHGGRRFRSSRVRSIYQTPTKIGPAVLVKSYERKYGPCSVNYDFYGPTFRSFLGIFETTFGSVRWNKESGTVRECNCSRLLTNNRFSNSADLYILV